jgi:sensor histidine kinase regulating citrate/malate metabolism
MKRQLRRQTPLVANKTKARAMLLLGIIVLVCLLVSASVMVVEHRMRAIILDEFLKNGLFVAKNLATVNTTHLATYNYVNLEQSVNKLTEENDLAYALVLLFDGEVAAYGGRRDIRQQVMSDEINQKVLKEDGVLVQYARYERAKHEICDIAVPVSLEGEKWGMVRLGFSLTPVHAAISRTRKTLFVIGLLVLLVGCSGSLLLFRFCVSMKETPTYC